MGKILLAIISIVILLAIFIPACSTKVEAGYVAVRVNLYGDNRGVDNKVLGAGRYFDGIGYEFFKYPVFTNLYPFTKDKSEGSEEDEAFRFQSKEGVKCDADIGVQCYADSKNVNILFQKYRREMPFIIKNYLKADIRDALNKHVSGMSVDSLYGNGKITLMKNILAELQEQYKGSGIVIENITLLSDIRFPEEITKGIVSKMSANQRAMQRENELREAEALAKKKIIKAEAEASANRAKMQTITPQLVEWERLQIQRDFISKWNGSSVPQTIAGGSSNFNLLFNTGK